MRLLLLSLILSLASSWTNGWVSDFTRGVSRLQIPTLDPAELRKLYPQRDLRGNGTLSVDNIHSMSYRCYGNGPLVALFLHGGPGAGCFPNHARFFSDQYTVVLLDQRGCGQSRPLGELRQNTLGDIVQDCEVLRRHLGIPRWDVVLGGSWGSTVAIALAQTYPNTIRTMVLRGVCLLRSKEVDWLFSSQGGAAKRFPSAWKTFADAVGSEGDHPRSVLHRHYRKLIAPRDEGERSLAAWSWMQWESWNSIAYKIPPSTNISDQNEVNSALNAWNVSSSPVAIHTPGQGWTLQDGYGATLSMPDLGDSQLPVTLRQGLDAGTTRELPFEPVPNLEIDVASGSVSLPVQAMLTCFYSCNEDYCRNYVDLLDAERLRRMASIPCIAIQGGMDSICPPDTALDLLEAWPQLELRIPLYAGHSMYDPFITNELVLATDRLAEYLINRKGA